MDGGERWGRGHPGSDDDDGPRKPMAEGSVDGVWAGDAAGGTVRGRRPRAMDVVGGDPYMFGMMAILMLLGMLQKSQLLQACTCLCRPG